MSNRLWSSNTLTDSCWLNPPQLVVDEAVLDRAARARRPRAARKACSSDTVRPPGLAGPEAEDGDRAVAAIDLDQQHEAVTVVSLVPGTDGHDVIARRRDAQRRAALPAGAPATPAAPGCRPRCSTKKAPRSTWSSRSTIRSAAPSVSSLARPDPSVVVSSRSETSSDTRSRFCSWRSRMAWKAFGPRSDYSAPGSPDPDAGRFSP